jgi:hypothetical protein
VTQPVRQPGNHAAVSEARRYQQLRGHLGYLKLNDAADALPRVLDAARTERLTQDLHPGPARRSPLPVPARRPQQLRTTIDGIPGNLRRQRRLALPAPPTIGASRPRSATASSTARRRSATIDTRPTNPPIVPH